MLAALTTRGLQAPMTMASATDNVFLAYLDLLSFCYAANMPEQTGY